MYHTLKIIFPSTALRKAHLLLAASSLAFTSLSTTAHATLYIDVSGDISYTTFTVWGSTTTVGGGNLHDETWGGFLYDNTSNFDDLVVNSAFDNRLYTASGYWDDYSNSTTDPTTGTWNTTGSITTNSLSITVDGITYNLSGLFLDRDASEDDIGFRFDLPGSQGDGGDEGTVAFASGVAVSWSGSVTINEPVTSFSSDLDISVSANSSAPTYAPLHGNDIQVVSSIPEPSAAILGLAGVAFLLFRRRR